MIQICFVLALTLGAPAFASSAPHRATGQRPHVVEIAGRRLGYTPLCAASLMGGMSLWFVWSGLVFLVRPSLRRPPGPRSGSRK